MERTQVSAVSEAAFKKLMFKYDAQLRRMCKVRASGKAGVTKEILEVWKQGGVARHGLVKMLADCKGDKARGSIFYYEIIAILILMC